MARGQTDSEDDAVAGCAVRLDRAAVPGHHLVGPGESEAEPAVEAGGQPGVVPGTAALDQQGHVVRNEQQPLDR